MIAPETPIAETTAPQSTDTHSARTMLREIIEIAVVTLLIFGLTRSLVLNFVVDGDSMLPTLVSGERIIANRNAYGEFNLGDLVDWLPGVPDQHWFTIIDWGEPERGDIIVLTPLPPGQQKPHVKRVIGLPGDHIRIDHRGDVFVNDVPLDEPYTGDYENLCNGSGSYRNCDVLVPDGNVFVMGDHRSDSADSRYFGVVPYDRIEGKAWLIYWPLGSFGTLTQPSYPELTPAP